MAEIEKAIYKENNRSYDTMNYINLEETCKKLSISTATAKNWVRLGKLKSEDNGKTFSKDYITELANEIKNGEDGRLKSRRNKKAVSGKEIYSDYIEDIENQYLIEKIIEKTCDFTKDEERILIANYAISFYRQKKNILDTDIVTDLNQFEFKNNLFKKLLSDYVGNIDISKIRKDKIKEVLKVKLKFSKDDDTLGCLYISLSDKGNRKKRGAYYTPKKIVDELLENVFEKEPDDQTQTYYDPCCGTGNFLQGLINKGIETNRVFGRDIDPDSVSITRINLFLLDDEVDAEILYRNISCENTLLLKPERKYSVILGNPPWGYEFSKEEIDELIGVYKTAKKKGIESFNLFIEKAFNIIDENGIIAYVLPESLLTVASHKKVRKIIVENSSFEFINYMGNIFSGVQCPAIILGLRVNGLRETVGCTVNLNGELFSISERREVSENSLPFNMTDEEYLCLKNINSVKPCVFLKGNADFALGIVTGNNKEYIKTKELDGYESILRGSDVLKYGIKDTDNKIKFLPDAFQQVAPTSMYRAKEKLLYRFISDIPVFTYDNQQTLSLNSCNILIPKFNDLDIKYILAILNSSVVAYYMTKKFNSVKRLKTHLEQIPIPVIDIKAQKNIIEKVDCLLNKEGEDKEQIYNELDEEIMNIYSLNEIDKKIIKKFMRNKNLFL